MSRRKRSTPPDDATDEAWLSSDDLAAVDAAINLRDAEIVRLEAALVDRQRLADQRLAEVQAMLDGAADHIQHLQTELLAAQAEAAKERRLAAQWHRRASAWWHQLEALRAQRELDKPAPTKPSHFRLIDRGPME